MESEISDEITGNLLGHYCVDDFVTPVVLNKQPPQQVFGPCYGLSGGDDPFDPGMIRPEDRPVFPSMTSAK